MLKEVAIRTVLPLSWRISPLRVARSLHRFSLVEADSAWQMLKALDAVEHPAFQVKLFNNALEEVRHAELFRMLATGCSALPVSVPKPPRKALFDERRGLAEFEAYHFVGEADVYAQFRYYADSAPAGLLRETFLAIRGDEEHHRELARTELLQLVGSESATRKLIRRVRLKRFKESCERLGKQTAGIWSAVLLSVLYALFGPIFGWLCRRHIDQQGSR